MEAVTSFHPNRFYFNDSGKLIYMLTVKNNQKEGLGVIVGPVLANAPDNITHATLGFKPSSIKLTENRIDPGETWLEIDLPKRVAMRVYLALREMADLFTNLSKSMNASVLTLEKSEEALTELGLIDPINVYLEKLRGMWRASPQSSHFGYDASFVFEDDESMKKFAESLKALHLCYTQYPSTGGLSSYCHVPTCTC